MNTISFLLSFFFFLMIRRPRRSPLFPYTTLFRSIPVVTVVTDRARTHAAWRSADVDLIIAPPPAGRGRGRQRRPAGDLAVAAGDGQAAAGLPGTREVWGGRQRPDERALLRRSLGLSESELLVVLTGGGGGPSGTPRHADA